MLRKLTAVIAAGVVLVGLLVFSGRAAASDEMRAAVYNRCAEAGILGRNG